MKLPDVLPQYNMDNERSLRRALIDADMNNVKKNAEVQMLRYVLTSPNGTRYLIGVDNAGNLTTTAV